MTRLPRPCITSKSIVASLAAGFCCRLPAHKCGVGYSCCDENMCAHAPARRLCFAWLHAVHGYMRIRVFRLRRPLPQPDGIATCSHGSHGSRASCQFRRAQEAGKFRAALKRPSSVKHEIYKAVPYARNPHAVPARRGDQIKCRRSIKDLLQADNKSIVKMLIDDKILPNWTGSQCPRCMEGKLSGLLQKRPGAWKYRCNRKHCQHYFSPHHLHPLFTDSDGSSCADLQNQSAVLLLKLTGVPTAAITKIVHVNHKAVEDLDGKLADVRRRFVESRQKTMELGDGHS